MMAQERTSTTATRRWLSARPAELLKPLADRGGGLWIEEVRRYAARRDHLQHDQTLGTVARFSYEELRRERAGRDVGGPDERPGGELIRQVRHNARLQL
jgi:hypothetical protein